MTSSAPLSVRFLVTVAAIAACGGDDGFTVRAALFGGGEVTSEPGGISCSGTRECDPHRFDASVMLTAHPDAGGDPFTGWLIWSGRQSDDARVVRTPTVSLTKANAGPDDTVYAFAFFGTEPSLDPGTAGSRGGNAGARAGGAGGVAGGSGGMGGGGGRDVPAGGASGVAGSAGAGGRTGAAGRDGGTGGSPALTCATFDPQLVGSGDVVAIRGTGFTDATRAFCHPPQPAGTATANDVIFSVRVESPEKLIATVPSLRSEVTCTVNVYDGRSPAASCPSPLKIGLLAKDAPAP